MIISHKHRFIFLKTSKTAGTSTEIALSKFCGPDDVITRTDEPDEKIRTERGYRGPQNNLVPYLQWRPRDLERLIRGRGRRERFKHHDTAAHVRKYAGESVWNSYYKFCTVRNPYERFVSYYYNMHPTEPRPSMREFLVRGIKELNENGIGVYTIDGKIVVDKLCRYESLQLDLEEVRQTIGLPERLSLPNAKGDFRKNKSSYETILDNHCISAIREAFKQEIDMFGY